MSFVAVAIGAGVGLLKAETLDAQKEKRQRTLAAETQRYSPWTGLKANEVQEADPLGSALQFGATAGQMRAGIQNAQAQQGLMQAQTKWLDAGGSPQYTAAQTATSNPASYGAFGPSQYGGSPWKLGSFNYGTGKF